MRAFDFLLLAVLLWGAYAGYKKGIIEGVAKVAGLVLGLLGGMALYEPVAKVLNAAFGLREKLVPLVKSLVHLPDSVTKVPMESFSQASVSQQLSHMKLPEGALEELHKMVTQLSKFQGQPGVETVADGLLLLIADFLVLSISFLIITFVIERVVYWIAKTVKYKALPTPLKMFDGSVGALLGLLKSTISTGLFLVILLPILELQAGSTGLVASLSAFVTDSTIVSWFFGLLNGSII